MDGTGKITSKASTDMYNQAERQHNICFLCLSFRVNAYQQWFQEDPENRSPFIYCLLLEEEPSDVEMVNYALSFNEQDAAVVKMTPADHLSWIDRLVEAFEADKGKAAKLTATTVRKNTNTSFS